MALSIKTDEADRLARDLARLTGETMTKAVTVALRERLERERAKPSRSDKLERLLEDLDARLQRRPVTAEEWALAGNDDWDDACDHKGRP